MFSSLNLFITPSHCILWSQTCSGLKRNKKYKKEQRPGVWRASRGKVQVCHSSCASQYKKCYNSYNSLVNKTGSGQAKSPCSLLNKKGLGNWQDSLLNRWCDAQSPLPVCSILQLFALLRRSIHVKEEQLWEPVSLRQESKQDLHPLFSLMAEESSSPSSTLKSSFLTLSFLWLLLRLAIPFAVSISLRVSLTRCRSLGRSQTTAPGSVSHGAGHTRWLLCSRSSTGPRSGCWKPSVYACAAPSDGRLLWRCPPAGTGRCPVYRTCL